MKDAALPTQDEAQLRVDLAAAFRLTARFDWHESVHGVRLIDGCLARFECARHAIHDGGDHAIIVGHVTAAAMAEGRPLLFAKGSYRSFTHSG